MFEKRTTKEWVYYECKYSNSHGSHPAHPLNKNISYKTLIKTSLYEWLKDLVYPVSL